MDAINYVDDPKQTERLLLEVSHIITLYNFMSGSEYEKAFKPSRNGRGDVHFMQSIDEG